MITSETNELSNSPIQQFYANQNILITGGTGFLGKVLIEKLLRSCRKLNSIYLLIRPKKGIEVSERVEKFFDDIIFDGLRKADVNLKSKVKAISGDLSLPGLGLTNEDRKLLILEISIIFNVAATVRFDEKIRTAVAINIQGTEEILKLSRQMANLKGVIHVSTAYSNCHRNEIDERFYDPPIKSDRIIKLVETLDDKQLEEMTQSILGDFPNTYTLTKQIAEEVVRNCAKDLPVGIFRPAIVISSCKEPFEGWIDNFYGPTGGLLGVGLGLIRIMHIDRNCTAELVPVDYCVNGIIAACWDLSHKNKKGDPPIYNYHSSWNNRITWGEYIELALVYGKQIPTIKSLWCYSLTIVNNIFLYYLFMFLLHIIPGLLVDIGLFIANKKPKALKIYKKIHKFTKLISYFSTNSWTFKNNNTQNLWNKLTLDDKKLFYFSMSDFNWNDFMKKCIVGLRIYIFKDELNTIKLAKKRMYKFIIIHRIIKYCAIILIVYVLFLLLKKII